MLIKISLLLLVAIAVLGIFGRTRFSGLLGSKAKPRIAKSAATCPDCGRHRIGSADCPCGKKG